MITIAQADQIADIAHTSRGQTRADGTPYIRHPRRVLALVTAWGGDTLCEIKLTPTEYHVVQCAALLHDVIEDTKITRDDLFRYGVDGPVLEIVDLMTKKGAPSDPEDLEYYQGIAGNDLAALVKAADRSANLEDSLQEVKEHRQLKRWKNYVTRTYADVLPIYKSLPFLRKEIEGRLKLIEEAMPPDKVQMPPPHNPPHFKPGAKIPLSSDELCGECYAWAEGVMETRDGVAAPSLGDYAAGYAGL